MRTPVKTISSKPISAAEYLRQVWSSRALVLTFAVRDLRIQYAQTYLGLLWSVIQPLTGLVIFYFFFQRLIHIDVNAPYAVFAFTGITGWFYFTSLVGQAGTSLMHNQHLVKKIHFPRLVLPLSKVITGLVEFLISSALLLLLMTLTGCDFSWKLLLFPLAILVNVVVGLSVGVWLSALTVRFRDLHHIIPYLVGFGIWLTPVFYPDTIVPQALNWIYYLHPPASIIALYRWIFLDFPINVWQVFSSVVVSVCLLVTGLLYFIRSEKFMADYL
ncbi:MAG: ABC transporter permease [Chitinophagales bacterium]|nr:ABC transporter permease [Chitinophagales bacterium]